MQKRSLKITGLVLASALLIGVVVGVTNLWVSRAGETMVIGYVDREKLESSYSDYKAAITLIQKEKQDMETAMNREIKAQTEKLDQETAQKKLLSIQAKYQDQLDKRQSELVKPVIDRMDKAIADVGKSEGVSVVLSKSAVLYSVQGPVVIPIVLYGGKDLTDIVLKKLESGKQK